MVEFRSDELDKFFKQGTKESENIVFREEAWDKMNILLNRQQRKRRIFFWLILAGVVLGIFSILFFTGVVFKSDTPSTPGSEPSSTPLVQQEQQEPDPLLQETKPTINGAPESEKNTGFDKVALQTTEAADNLISIDNTGNINHTDKVEVKQASQNDHSIAREQTNPDAKEKDAKASLELEIREQYSFENISKKDFYVISPKVHLDNIVYQPGPERKRRKGRFALGIQFSPEVISVGIGDFNKSDYKIGAYASYAFSNRIQALFGLMYTNKKYLAGPGEYDPPYGFWPKGIAPIATNGECEILEIPLEITYHFQTLRRGNLYLGLGLSNLFMLNEVYTYEYSEPVSGARRYWHTFDNELYWLSFGQIHLGYRTRFGRNYALSFGPYLQFPFKGVGHGHVNLYSIGTQISFNRFFNSKKINSSSL